MPYIPQQVSNATLNADTLNAIGNDIGVGAKVIAGQEQTLWAFGDLVLSNNAFMNPFINTLYNKCVTALFTSYAYRSPYARLKKGIMEFGDGIEEVFVNAPEGHAFNNDFDNPENPLEVFKPDVRVQYHMTNSQRYYPASISRKTLRRAFYNFGGLDNLVAGIVESLYSGNQIDEELLTKFTIAKHAIAMIDAGKSVAVSDPANDPDSVLVAARAAALKLPHASTAYNEWGVWAHTPIDKLTVFIDADDQALVDVKSLAAAFNLDRADFIGRVITTPNFTFTDEEKERILKIAKDENNQTITWPFTSEQETKLATVCLILADDDLLQIWDTEAPYMGEARNDRNLYYTNYLHVWQTFKTSKVANCIVYTKTATPEG